MNQLPKRIQNKKKPEKDKGAVNKDVAIKEMKEIRGQGTNWSRLMKLEATAREIQK